MCGKVHKQDTLKECIQPCELNHFFAVLGAAALIASFSGAANAQPPKMGTMQHHPTMGRMMHRPNMGSIIGNRKTKVYHLAGDKGNMPDAKNRIYFHTERDAIRAGYHLAGRKMPPHRMMPMKHPMSGHMNGHLPK